MRLRSFILIVIIIILQGCRENPAPRIREGLSFQSHLLQRSVKYSIYLPPGYFKTEKHYPVVYLLHGLGDDESSWLEYGNVSQIAEHLIRSDEIGPMIMVMPQGWRDYYVNRFDGSFPYMDMFIKELLPHIDSVWRTIPEGKYRGISGYSMGGFGALNIALMNPSYFGASVPMSISVRTDEQYATEYGPEWDVQWGRIFGGAGKTGEDRITPFYKENSPFHLVRSANPGRYDKISIYIDNGDDEETLAYSNTELHNLMRECQVKHEFRVRDGGHEFRYWKESLVNGLRFMNDAFEGKPYRGDINEECIRLRKDAVITSVNFEGHDFYVSLPEEYLLSDRLFPMVVISGLKSAEERSKMANLVKTMNLENLLPPLLLVFTDQLNAENELQLIALMENQYRARPGWRFRSVIAWGNSAEASLELAFREEQYTCLSLIGPQGDFRKIQSMWDSIAEKKPERTWFFIESTSDSEGYRFAGGLHLLFKRHDLRHEYRVRGKEDGYESAEFQAIECLKFTANKIHR